MITCKLYGRIGNQMFQIAATIAHAVKNGFEYKFPTETINPKVWDIHPFDLPIISADEYEKIETMQEISFRYHGLPPKWDNIKLDGYYQSYLYFEDIIPRLQKAFKIPNVTHWNSIAVHVRRGDYLKYSDKHPVLPLSYYISAIKYIVSERNWKPDDFEIIVYSDDYEYCINNFTKENIGYHCHVKFSGDEHPVNDLYAMTMAQDIIIANSSFSYWAAILNPNSSKIVITPDARNWFGEGNKHLCTVNLLPPTWIQQIVI
jgi:hypothetical protein